MSIILLILALTIHKCTGFNTLNTLRQFDNISSKSMCTHTTTPIHHRYQPQITKRPNTLTMGLEIKIRIVGKKSGGEKWLDSSYSTYETRLKSTNLKVTTQWHKNNEELVKGIEGDTSKSHGMVLLDPLGKMCTSEKFSDDMYHWLEEGGSRLTFVIGGAEGLPEEVKMNYGSRMLSLSSLTFTHQFARILLMEQIYRASEIKKGSGYHK